MASSTVAAVAQDVRHGDPVPYTVALEPAARPPRGAADHDDGSHPVA